MMTSIPYHLTALGEWVARRDDVDPVVAELKHELAVADHKLHRIQKFCLEYYHCRCGNFANPDNGELVSANYEVRAFANAILRGPLTSHPDDIDLPQPKAKVLT